MIFFSFYFLNKISIDFYRLGSFSLNELKNLLSDLLIHSSLAYNNPKKKYSPEASLESCAPHPLSERGAVLLQGEDVFGLLRPGGGRGSPVVFLEEIWFFHNLVER